MAETDRQKFKRLAEKRVTSLLRNLRLVGNLSNRSNYDYTSEDIEKIFSAINRELKACKSRFIAEPSESESDFKLD